MFSATKFLVAGAIVALFGGVLLTGVLRQQPSDESLPPAAVSASALLSPEATSDPAPDQSVRSDVLPGVDLQVEQVQPGVYRVLSDGSRSVQGRSVVVSSTGDVWLLRGSSGNWNIVRLGDPEVSLHLTDGKKRRVSLRLDADGRPLVESWVAASAIRTRAQVFDGTTWLKTDLTPYSPCPYEGSDSSPKTGVAPPDVNIMPDGSCWEPGNDRFKDGYWGPVPKAELGLPDDQFVEANTVGPDGTGWASVRSEGPAGPTTFDGLLRYDGQTWTHIPLPSSMGESADPAFTADMAVAPDGTVWLLEYSPESVTVRAWDGATWASYGPSVPPTEDWCGAGGGCAMPRGIHFNTDGTIWFMGGRLFFDGASLHPFDLWLMRPSLSSFAPDGTVWALGDGHLYAITPEAATGTG